MIGGGGRGGGRAGAGDGRRRELATALGSGALPGRRRLLLGRPGLGTAAALLLLATLGPPVLEPHLENPEQQPGVNNHRHKQPQHFTKKKATPRSCWEYIMEENWGLLAIKVHFHPGPLAWTSQGSNFIPGRRL